MNKLLKILVKFKIFFLFLSGVVIFDCSTAQTSKDNPLEIKDISVNAVANRAPKENEEQVNLELLGIMNEDNLNQDIDYKWYVEFLKPDIKEDATTLLYSNEDYDDKQLIESNNNYFIEVSNSNPLNALLSLYKAGYYKITLQAYYNNEIKASSVIIKSGEPKLPNLLVKVNIPESKDIQADNFKGKFYLKFNNETIELNAKVIKDQWFDTGIQINPFLSFNIRALTHLIDLEKNKPASNNSEDDSLKYLIDNEEEEITSYPIILKNVINSKLFITKNKEIIWKEGDTYISFLIWKEADSISDRFQYIEKILNESNKSLSINFNNTYLAKIFVGSFGYKPDLNDYFIYFGPEGTNIDELDPNQKREIPALPFGYLIGKLGKEGKVFPIGETFSYEVKEFNKNLSF